MTLQAIAIIGLGCRFPGANNPAAFWQLLRDGVDAITEVPPERWDGEQFYDTKPGTPGKMNTCLGGFLEQVDLFDADFFGISSQEAEQLDPQQRLTLEVAWEAIENAGILPGKLAGSATGVFMGMGHFDYHRLVFKDETKLGPYSATGASNCIVPNRLSYLLGLQGPSVLVDTACSSSLCAIHLACQSLRNGESNLCLAGGVNLMLFPETTVAYAQSGLIASDGHCKTFDASADGYVRGEGCGVVVLKRLEDALSDGDNIWAIIKGSAINQNGASSGLTIPNGIAQQEVISQALASAGVSPTQISYVEAHGSGTLMGDLIEMESLKAVLMSVGSTGKPCWVGSVKTNIGNLEAASGMASLIKVVLSLHYGEIPPHLHLKQLNPHISLEGTSLSIPTEGQPWPATASPRLAGISSFGFGGANAHVILEEAPVQPPVLSEIERPLHLLTLRAKTEKALQELAQSYQEFLKEQPEVPLADICFTTNTGRGEFNHRLVALAGTTGELKEKLSAFTEGRELVGLLNAQVKGRKRPKVAFVLTSQDVLAVEVGRQLYETQPTFRRLLTQCDEIFKSSFKQSLLSILYREAGLNSPVAEASYASAALFALHYALAQLWQSWGIKPAAIMGYGVGEYVAACLAGVFSLADGLKLVAAGEQLEKTISQVTLSTPNLKLVSSITGQLEKDKFATPEYWLERLKQPWQLTESFTTLSQQKCEIFLEISTHRSLLQREVFSESGRMLLSSLQPGQSDWQSMLLSLGELYIRGVPVDWSGFDRDYLHRRVPLPTYPFQRQRYWLDLVSNESQKPDLLDQEYAKSSILNLLNQGDTKQLTQRLVKTGNFSPEQKQLLPVLLEVLAREYQIENASAVAQQKTSQESRLLERNLGDFVSPRDELELRLTKVWEKVLEIHPIGLQDNFFHLGGNSQLALRLFSAIESELEKKIPVAALFKCPTIEQLANLVRQSEQLSTLDSLVLLKPGLPDRQPLFLIHDPDGKIIIYHNLAQYLESDRPVYGVQPYSREGFLILHTRLRDMADYYIEKIRSVQPEGPYLLGGLCAGGMLAFEMAVQLQAQGQQVALVALLDAADVQAYQNRRNARHLARGRRNRLAQMLAESQQFSQIGRLGYILAQSAKKAQNFIAYESRTRVEKFWNQTRTLLYRYFLDRNLSLPSFLQNIPSRRILEFDSLTYIPGVYQGRVTLFRATEAKVLDDPAIDDTPFTQLIEDPLLGWSKRVTEGVEVYDIPGGHSSMLQEPYVQVLAEKLQACINTALLDQSNSPRFPKTPATEKKDKIDVPAIVSK